MTSLSYEQRIEQRRLIAEKLRLLLDEKTEHPPSEIIAVGIGRKLTPPVAKEYLKKTQ